MGWMGHGAWGGAFWVILIALLVLVVLLAVRWPGREREDPLDILKRRYARGEIDRDTFERMRADLSGDSRNRGR